MKVANILLTKQNTEKPYVKPLCTYVPMWFNMVLKV